MLVTPGGGAVHTQERLADAYGKRTLLAWGEQYEWCTSNGRSAMAAGRV